MHSQAQREGEVEGFCEGGGGGTCPAHDRGVALVITLLLLFLMSVLGLAAVLTSSSDMLINGYYRNFRGSYYAADSGLAIARQQLVDQVEATVPATFAAGTPPISTAAATTAATTALNYITGHYGDASQTQNQINQGTAASSWAGRYKITNPTFSYVSGPTAFNNGAASGYDYVYSYSLTSVGMTSLAATAEQSAVSESGNINIRATVTAAAASTVNFAAYGMFINTSPICNGSYLVPGTISGPVFTNGAWNFGPGTYKFTDQVGQAGAQAGFQNGSCTQSTGASANGISPNFQGGRQWGQNPIPLPPNDFNQKLAVVDGIGKCTSGTCPTSAQLTTNPLRTLSGTTYPTSGTPPQGVYIPHQTIGGYDTFTGGGIMVQGDAQVTLSTGNGSGTNSQQIITVRQGSGGSAVTTTITIDPVANTTRVVSGGSTLNLTGVPANCAMVNPAPTTCSQSVAGSIDGTMVYVTGNITSITGPSSGPAIANGSAMSVVASADISITGDLKYVASPVTTTDSTNPPIDTLIPGNDTGQVLGLFTAGGDINLNYPTSGANHEIDASIAAISAGGTGGLVNNGNAVNTLTIIGGRIQSTIQNINSSTRNVLFDRRFAGNFAPPWFPSTTVTPAGLSSSLLTQSVSRVRWVSLSSE